VTPFCLRTEKQKTKGQHHTSTRDCNIIHEEGD